MGERINAKLRWTRPGVLIHWCPGCEMIHPVHIGMPNHLGAKWTYNEIPDCPTLSPSVNISLGTTAAGIERRCHYWLRNGKLEFCSDTTHEYSGQTINLPDLPWDEQDD